MRVSKVNVLALAFMLVSGMGMANAVSPENNGVKKNLVTVNEDPVFKKKGDRLFLNLLNLNQDKVTIKILDQEGRLVFIETLKGDMVIEKAFNFENAFENEYTVIVVDDKKTFKETIEVK